MPQTHVAYAPRACARPCAERDVGHGQNEEKRLETSLGPTYQIREVTDLPTLVLVPAVTRTDDTTTQHSPLLSTNAQGSRGVVDTIPLSGEQSQRRKSQSHDNTYT